MGRHGRFENFRIGPSLLNRIESEVWNGQFEFESNLEALQQSQVTTISRLLNSWPTVVSYFQSLMENCPKRIEKCIHLPSEATNGDDGGIRLQVIKVYLHFVLNMCTVFQKTVLALEKDAVTVCELYPIMTELRQKLQDRLADNFFTFDANTILVMLSKPLRQISLLAYSMQCLIQTSGLTSPGLTS